MQRTSVLAWSLTLGALGALPVFAAPPVYDVQMFVLQTPREPARIEARRTAPAAGSLAVRGRFAIHWGDDSLDSDGTQLQLNGRELPAPGQDRPASDGRVSVLAAPRLRAPLGPVQIKAGTEPAQYFEREADGRFALRTLPVTPELDLELTLAKGSGSGLHVTWGYRLVQLGKRAPLTGVTLEVGAPQVRELSGRAELDVTLGEWCLVGVGDGGLASGLVVAFRISAAR